ncbi:hypothetical protein [Aliiroseovarius sp. xm-v-208]|uniref:hypothetical protein n=1 Tax=Aliiroseovarius sp. xm-v-208 TaxID=2651835 RepID=UPI001568B163|nr:hypothetical protein [Aliiroseovarius sp. xm-v-208]
MVFPQVTEPFYTSSAGNAKRKAVMGAIANRNDLKRFDVHLRQGKVETPQKISMSWAFRDKHVCQVYPETLYE